MATHGKSHLRALYTVFVRPALVQQSRPCFSIARQLRPRPNNLCTPHQRCFSQSPSHLALRRHPPGGGKNAKAQNDPKQARSVQNQDIPARRIQIVDSDNRLGDFELKNMVLRSIDLKRDRLVCVQKVPSHLTPDDVEYDETLNQYDEIVARYKKIQGKFGKDKEKDAFGEVPAQELNEDDAEEMRMFKRAPAILIVDRYAKYIRLPNGEEWMPVCKIENMAEAKRRAKDLELAKKEERKWAPEGIKVIELNWAIDGNDLGHRLKKLDELLRTRRIVEVVFAPKRRGRKATDEECRSVIEKVKKVIKDVPGAKETKPFAGKLGGVASIFAEGDRTKPKEVEAIPEEQEAQAA